MPRLRQKSETIDGQKLGLICRACGCEHFRVIYLKRLLNGVLMRLRECRHCGKRITTRESAS